MSEQAIADLEATVRRAQKGDRRALESVITAVERPIYNLAVRMLWHPQDAEDATQEILVRIVTKLGSFRGDAGFRTWAWRVAANHLLNTRKRRAERWGVSFEAFADDLERDRTDGDLSTYPEGEQALLVEEVKIGCTLAMLQCLDRPHRIAYVLGEVFEVDSEQGGRILDVSAAAFRKRLSRARARVRAFMQGHCGLVNPGNACRCAGRVDPAVAQGRVTPGRLMFAREDEGGQANVVARALEDMEELQRTAAIFQGHPDWSAPEDFRRELGRLLDSGRYEALLDGSERNGGVAPS